MIKHFYRPETVSEALKLKRQYGAKARWFGGGTWINNALGDLRCERAISVERLRLDRIVERKGRLEIGAGVTLQQMIDAPQVWPVLRQAAGFLWSRNLRNMATVGGNIGLGRGDSCLIPCLLALEADLETAAGGRIPLEEYVRRGRNDLIRKVSIPPYKGVCRLARVARQAKGPVVVNVAARLIWTDNRVKKARIVLGGVGERVLRLKAIERKLEKDPVFDRKTLEAAAAEALAPPASAYQAYIAGVTIADLVLACQKENKAYEN